MAVKINNISYSGFFFNGEALTAMYLNGNKVYGSEPQEYSITLTPVEWVSNENINTRIWLDLGYVWKNNSRAQLGFVIPGTHQKPNGQQVFGEDTVWASDGNGPVDDNNDLRLFFTKSGSNIGAYWDVATSRTQATIGAITDIWQYWEIGNNYIKNLSNNTNFVTGSTYNISRTGTVGLYGACQYLNTGRTDCVRYSYVKIYEGDTLVKDIIPVLDNNNIPCFFDKISEELIYYKVNGEPSTGLTAGNATGSTIKIVYSESSVTITNSSTSGITIGNTFNLNASVVPTGSTLTYTSSNPLVASVDSNGIVSGVASGSTTITITASEYVDDENRIVYRSGTSTVNLSVEASQPVWTTSAQTISYTALPQGGLEEGSTHNLNASISPIGGTLSYSSSNPSIATVDSNGIVTAVAEGNATITISVGAWDDNVNHIHYTASSETVSVVVNGAEVVTYDYIQGDGSDYIMTDYAPDTNTEVEVMYMSQSDNYKCLFGCDGGSRTQFSISERSTGTKLFFERAGQHVDANIPSDILLSEEPWTAKMTPSGAYISGDKFGNFDERTFISDYSLAILGCHVDTDMYPESVIRQTTAKIYYVKIWENGVLLHNYLPVVKGNKVGMLDAVTSTFIASATQGATVANDEPLMPPIYFDASNAGNVNIKTITSDGLSGETKSSTAAKTVYFNVDSRATSSQRFYSILTSDSLAEFYDPDGSRIIFTNHAVSGVGMRIPDDINKTGTYKLVMPGIGSFFATKATFQIIPPSN